MQKKAKDESIKNKKVASKKASPKLTDTNLSTKQNKHSVSVSKTASLSRTTKKINNPKISTKKNVTKNKNITEYYDLPNLYNQTIVKILAQTPTVLFVYWDISSDDKKYYLEKYGQNFFNNTIPYLTVTNKTKNYSFEIEINDYANSWYINIPDSDCQYDVILFRKQKKASDNTPIFISSSNNLQTPNDHILFDNLGKNVFFKNIKTNQIEQKSTASLSFMKNIGKVYNIYDFYKKIYKNELLNNYKLGSNLTSSRMSY